MRTTHEESDVVTIGIGAKTKAKIHQTREAFRILSKGLYTKPIEAIVRELASNAWDSHRAAGKLDVPFKLHLPTQLEPWFAIEDFGIGLDDEGIQELYTGYFGTSKNQSEDDIGGFGLGSKTPFCYTDSFTIISTQNHIARTYTVFVGDDGCPWVSLLNEETVEKDNGLLCQFPVEDKEIRQSAFKTAAEYTLQEFRVKPECNYPLNFSIQDAIIDKPRYKWFKGSNSLQLIAVMGQVQYPVDLNHIKNKFTNDLAKAVVKYNGTVKIYFEIGELEVPPSRESVLLNDYSIKAIEDALIGVDNNFASMIIDEVEACENHVKACNKLISFKQILGINHTTSRYYYKWEEEKNFENNFYKRYSKFNLNYFKHGIRKFEELYPNLMFIKSKTSMRSNAWVSDDHQEQGIFDTDGNFEIIFIDQFMTHYYKALMYFENNRKTYKTLYFVYPKKVWDDKKQRIDNMEQVKKEAELLLNEIGLPYSISSDEVNVDDFTFEKEEEIEEKIASEFFVFNAKKRWGAAEWNKVHYRDLPDTVYYLPLNHGLLPFTQDKYELRSVVKLIAAITETPQDEIYYIPERCLGKKKIKNDPRFINLLTMSKTIINCRKAEEHEWWRALIRTNNRDRIHEHMDRLQIIAEHLTTEKDKIKKFLNFFEVHSIDSEALNFYNRMCEHFNITQECDILEEVLTHLENRKLWTKINASWSTYRDSEESVIELAHYLENGL